MRRIGIDGVIGLVLLVLCAELYRESYYFRVPQFATMSPSTWPRFLLILLATLSIVLLAQALRQPQARSLPMRLRGPSNLSRTAMR